MIDALVGFLFFLLIVTMFQIDGEREKQLIQVREMCVEGTIVMTVGVYLDSYECELVHYGEQP